MVFSGVLNVIINLLLIFSFLQFFSWFSEVEDKMAEEEDAPHRCSFNVHLMFYNEAMFILLPDD